MVLNHLYQFTPLQDSFSLIFLALVDGKPRVLSFKALLEEFLRHRVTVIRRTQVRDVVRATLLAGRADLPSGEVFSVADPAPCGWEDIGRIAARLLGKRPVDVRLPLWTAYLASAASEGVGRLFGAETALLTRSKINR